MKKVGVNILTIPDNTTKIYLDSGGFLCCEYCWESFMWLELYAVVNNKNIEIWHSEEYSSDYNYDGIKEELSEIFKKLGLDYNEVNFNDSDYPGDWEFVKEFK